MKELFEQCKVYIMAIYQKSIRNLTLREFQAVQSFLSEDAEILSILDCIQKDGAHFRYGMSAAGLRAI